MKGTIKIVPRKREQKAVLGAILSTQSQFRFWLEELRKGLGVWLPFPTYFDKQKQVSMITSLLPRTIIQVAFGEKSIKPSLREMALVGDGLWTTSLRIILVNQGFRNGEVSKRIGESHMESREYLGEVGKKLNLQSYLPLVLEIPDPGLHPGELAEAFLGWVFTYAGKKACLSLAKKYLEVNS